MTVYLIAGPPCAGKSTLARRLAQPRDTVLDFDDICHELSGTKGWDHGPEVRRRAGALMQQRIQLLPLRTGDSYLIRCAPSAALRAQLAERLGCVVWVLDPGADECLRRAQQDKRPRGTYKAIKRWYQDYSPAQVDSACPFMCGDVARSTAVRASRVW